MGHPRGPFQPEPLCDTACFLGRAIKPSVLLFYGFHNLPVGRLFHSLCSLEPSYALQYSFFFFSFCGLVFPVDYVQTQIFIFSLRLHCGRPSVLYFPLCHSDFSSFECVGDSAPVPCSWVTRVDYSWRAVLNWLTSLL